MDPVSVRQNNERSPKINIESGAFELLKTKMSTACSPILNDQSICEGKKKDHQNNSGVLYATVQKYAHL